MAVTPEEKDALLELQSLVGSHEFVQRVEALSTRAAAGDSHALSVVAGMLKDCADEAGWQSNGRWCSAAAHALAKAGTEASLSIFAEHVRTMKTSSYGAVELLSTLMPAFGAKAGPASFVLARMAAASAPRAVGIQSLCHLFLENLLQPEQEEELRRLLLSFERDSYLTEDLAELAQIKMASRSNTESDTDKLQSDLDDVILFE